jgi:hypothetical protein
MRIRQHVSILLLVTISGAVLLATVIGALLVSVERRAETLGLLSADFRNVAALARSSHDLLDTVDHRTDAADWATVITPEVERCQADIAALRVSDLLAGTPIMDELNVAFESMLSSIERLAAGPPNAAARNAHHGAAHVYRLTLERLLERASVEIHTQRQGLKTRQQQSFRLIGVATTLYLVVVMVAREWVVRRLVSPIEQLTKEVNAAARDPHRFFGSTT